MDHSFKKINDTEYGSPGIVLNISMKLRRQTFFFMICKNKKLILKPDLNITVIFYPVATEYIYQHVMYSLPHPTVYLSR